MSIIKQKLLLFPFFKETINNNEDNISIVSVGEKADMYVNGESVTILSKGRDASIISTGNKVNITTLGFNSNITVTGSSARVSCLSDNSKLISTKEGIEVVSTGMRNRIHCLGKNSQITCSGFNSRVLAGLGSIITFIEWSDTEPENVPLYIRTLKVDNIHIKANIEYIYINAEFVEYEEYLIRKNIIHEK